jgi:hypothetical protein
LHALLQPLVLNPSLMQGRAIETPQLVLFDHVMLLSHSSARLHSHQMQGGWTRRKGIFC